MIYLKMPHNDPDHTRLKSSDLCALCDVCDRPAATLCSAQSARRALCDARRGEAGGGAGRGIAKAVCSPVYVPNSHILLYAAFIQWLVRAPSPNVWRASKVESAPRP